MSNKNIKVGVQIDTQVKNLKDIDRLINELEQSGVNVDKLRKQSQDLSQTWGNLGAGEQSQALNKMQGELDKSTNQTGRLERASGKLKNSFIGLKTAIASAFAVGGITAFFRSAVSGAASLEEQLSKVQAVSGATDTQMQAIAESAEQLGASTRYTATEAAQGFEILARAGLDTQQSLTAIPSVLDLAQASGIGLADAAGFITKTVAGMNMAMDESGHVADVLAMAAASANTDVAGLGQALSYAAPTANSLGVSLEDTVAIIGKFADAGIDASRAGTALNSIMAQFSNPASKFRQELHAIGINTGDFVEALRQLEASGQRGAKAINAVGMEAGPALKALLAQGMESVDALSGKLDDADGSAQKMANTMNDNLPGAVKGLSSAWDTLKNNLGKPLLEPLKEQVNKLAQTLRTWVADGTVASIGQSIATGFKAATKAVSLFAEHIGKFIAGLGLAKAASIAYTATLGSFTTAAGAATVASRALLTALRGFAGLGLGLAITGIAYAYDKLASSVDKVTEAQNRAMMQMVDANVVMQEVAASVEIIHKANENNLKTQKEVLDNELQAIAARIKGYESQIAAAGDKWKEDNKAVIAAKAAIAAEQERRIEVEKTATVLGDELQRRKDLIEAEKAQAAANQASVNAWQAITGSINKAAEAQLKIPPRSQEIIDGLAQLKTASGETSKNIEYLFTQALKEIETPEALRIVRIQLDELRESGRLAALAYHDLVEAIKEKSKEMPDAISEADVALKELGFTAKELQTGISESAEQTINHFATAAQKFGDDAKQMQVIYQAALKRMTNDKEIEALNAKFAEVSKTAKLTAQEIEKIGQAGIDAANQANPAFKALADNIKKATNPEQLKQLEQAARKAFDEGKISASQLETVIKTLKAATQELTEETKELGSENEKTHKNSTASVKETTAAIREQTAALKEQAGSSRTASGATKKGTAATKKGTAATKGDSKAKDDNAKSTRRAGAAQVSFGKELANNANAWKVFDKALRDTYSGGFDSFVNAHNAAWAAVKRLREEVISATAANDALNAKIDAGTVTMADLGRVANAASRGIGRLDDAQLKQLNATLDKARNKIRALKDEARQAAQETADRVLEATGTQEQIINRRFQREIQAMREKAKNNVAGQDDYNQAIANLEKLRQIELDKARQQRQEREREQQRQEQQQQRQQQQRQRQEREREQQRQQRQEQQRQQAASQSVNAGTLQKDINQAVTAGISQSDLSGLVKSLGENAGKALVEQMRLEAKRLPR